MILSWPPQFGQCSRSRSNTRFSSRAQLSRTGWWARAPRLALGGLCLLGRRLGLLRHHLRHHQRAQLGVGRQHAVLAKRLSLIHI